MKAWGSGYEYSVVIITATGRESCHLRAGLWWAVWEATVNSCWVESLFIVRSLAQRSRQAWSPDHTHVAAGSGCSRYCIELQGSPGYPVKDDSTNKETQESWENSCGTTQLNTPKRKVQHTTPSPADQTQEPRTSCKSHTTAPCPETVSHSFTRYLLGTFSGRYCTWDEE